MSSTDLEAEHERSLSGGCWRQYCSFLHSFYYPFIPHSTHSTILDASTLLSDGAASTHALALGLLIGCIHSHAISSCPHAEVHIKIKIQKLRIGVSVVYLFGLRPKKSTGGMLATQLAIQLWNSPLKSPPTFLQWKVAGVAVSQWAASVENQEVGGYLRSVFLSGTMWPCRLFDCLVFLTDLTILHYVLNKSLLFFTFEIECCGLDIWLCWWWWLWCDVTLETKDSCVSVRASHDTCPSTSWMTPGT